MLKAAEPASRYELYDAQLLPTFRFLFYSHREVFAFHIGPFRLCCYRRCSGYIFFRLAVVVFLLFVKEFMQVYLYLK